MESCSHLCACVWWELRMHFRLWIPLGPTCWPEQLLLHQFMMQFLFKVMKYTWLLPPDRTDAKNTWGAAQTPRTRVSVTSLNLAGINEPTVPHGASLTLSFLSHRNFSLWALLCMKTPSRWPVSTERISMAFSPHPMIWLEQIWAARQNKTWAL